MPATAHNSGLRHAALLAAAILTAYCNALLWGQFQFDDFKVIVDNPGVHSWQAWRENLGHGIRPLLKLAYTLDWTNGWGAAGFHLSNLLIHYFNALLVLALSHRFCETQPALREQAATISLFAALLFALHPIHTEAVTYLCGRSSALMTLFFLCGTLTYLTGRQRDNPLLLHVLTPLAFLAALGVKETAAMFPPTLLALESICGGGARTAARRQWTSWLLLAAGTIFFFVHPAYRVLMADSAGLNNLAGNLANQLHAVVWLLRQWWLPLWPNIDPDLPLSRGLGDSLPQAALCAALLLAMLSSWRRRPWIALAIVWLFVQLLPLHLFLPRIDVANERQMYLAGWPLALALGAELALRLEPRRFMVATAALLLGAAVLTVDRNRDYRSEIALWQATVRHSPDKARPHNNLGYAYRLAGRTDEARAEFRRALQLDPNYIKARGNLARMDEEAATAARQARSETPP